MARELHLRERVNPERDTRGGGRRTLWELVRSATAGTVGGATDLLLLVGLVELAGLAPGSATLVSAAAGSLVNFFLTRSFAFRSRGPIVRQGGLYAIATAVWVGLSAIVVHACVGFVRLPYVAARIVADVAVFLGWGFPSSRWIFRRA